MKKIIVVDDDPTNAGLTKMILEMDGFDVTACTDIEQAIEAANVEVAAFVVDVHLARGRSGLELLTAVRAGETDAAPDTAVFMTSGDYRREQDALQAGADLFLLKPYAPNVLSTALQKVTDTEGNDG